MNFIVQGKVKPNPGAPIWLKPILEHLRHHCRDDVMIILTQSEANSKLKYRLEHRRSKLIARIEKRRKTISVEIIALRHDPFDMVQTWSQTEQLEIDLTHPHIEPVSQFLQRHICVKNQFWHNQFERTRISATPDPDFLFYGGKVVDVLTLDQHCEILTESGMRYNVPAQHVVEPHRRGSYLILSKQGRCGFVSETDFKTFFIMA